MNRNLFANVAKQVSENRGVSRTPRLSLAKKVFFDGGTRYVAIEQNPATDSKWARLAQRGHKVVQFKDADSDKYVGVSVDGEITEY